MILECRDNVVQAALRHAIGQQIDAEVPVGIRIFRWLLDAVELPRFERLPVSARRLEVIDAQISGTSELFSIPWIHDSYSI